MLFPIYRKGCTRTLSIDHLSGLQMPLQLLLHANVQGFYCISVATPIIVILYVKQVEQPCNVSIK